MTETMYRVCSQIEGSEKIDRGEPVSKSDAKHFAEIGNHVWGRMIKHWVEPVPPYATPAITHEGDLETRAGSPPRGADDDLLGLGVP